MNRWIDTYTGVHFDCWNIKQDDIRIHDIGVALGNVCRFSGHTPWHYSVAQHSLLMSYQVPERFALEALLHDAAEAYMGDVPAPIRSGLSCYNAVMELVEAAIASKYGLVYPWPDKVIEADKRMFATECVAFGRNTKLYGMLHPAYDDVYIERMTHAMATDRFLFRFLELAKRKMPFDIEKILRKEDD